MHGNRKKQPPPKLMAVFRFFHIHVKCLLYVKYNAMENKVHFFACILHAYNSRRSGQGTCYHINCRLKLRSIIFRRQKTVKEEKSLYERQIYVIIMSLNVSVDNVDMAAYMNACTILSSIPLKGLTVRYKPFKRILF